MRLSLFFALALVLTPATSWAARVGKPAPSFVIVTYDGERVPFDSLRGKVVILNYWATWCAPCRNEIPEIDRFVRRHPNAPLAVYAITLDKNVPYARLRFLADTLKFPLVENLKGSGYGTIQGAVPTNYVIDKAGVVRHAKAGAFTLASLEALVGPLLTEPTPPDVATPSATSVRRAVDGAAPAGP